MALFAYTVQIDGRTLAGEIEAEDHEQARQMAHERHRDDGEAVEVHMVFRPPPRLGTPRAVPTMPTEAMRDLAARVTFQSSIYERSIRRERRIRRAG